jgi:type I restriction enzyme, S subunit
MSGMNFLEKLLDGVAVEWKALGALGEFVRGSGLQKSDFTDSGIGCIHYGQIYTFYGDYAYQTKSFVSSTLATKLRKAQKSDLIIATTSENIEDVCRTLVWLGEEEVCVSGETYIFKHNQNPKYLAYYLKTPHFFDFKKRNRTGTKVIRVHGDRLATFQIPIPCPDNPDRSLAIQAEIVRILDTFTELTAELTAELIDRKKQYNYYRDRLLTFEKGEVEWKTLGEVALDFGRGKSKHRPRNDPKLYGGDNPFIQTGDIRNASHIIEIYSQTYSEIGLKQSKLWPKGTLCITIAANIAETSILGFDACFPDSVIGFVANPEKTTSGYVEYLLSSLKTKLEEMGQGSAQSNINMGTFENLRLPFPPLAEQVRIASLLDKFDTLTTSISEGLPREIALRQKQYEYYRDLLLTFPKSEEVEV